MEAKQKGDHRETALVIACGLIVLWLIYDYKPLIYTSLGVGLIGAFIPSLSKLIHWAWYKLAEGLGWIMSKVILTLFFYLFLTPVAILTRLFRSKDLLKLKKPQESAFVQRNHEYSKDDLRDVW